MSSRRADRWVRAGRRRGARLLVCGLAVMALVACASPAAAHDTGLFKGPKAAGGRSPHGVPWRIYAGISGESYMFSFDMKRPAYPDVGYFTSIQRPLSKRFVFTALSGSDLSRFPEGDVSGVTGSAAREVVFRMSDGSRLRVRPRRPNARAIRLKPWLGQFRFFDEFFPDRIYPKAMKVFDDEGTLLGKARSNRGIFEQAR